MGETKEGTTPTAGGVSAPGTAVGKPMDRVDGRLKVTGGARYSAEMPVTGVLHGVLIQSKVARGRVASMDTATAEKAPGVRLVLTPFNAPKLPTPQPPANGTPQNRQLSLLQNDRVYYDRQPIGVVVADTLEQATHAATLVRIQYADTGKAVTDLHKGQQYTPKQVQRQEPDTHRGDISAGNQQAKARITGTYGTPMENHNPMEPHATIAVWESPEKLTVYDATQGVFGVRSNLARIFALQPGNVRCVCHFTGGGFGCKGTPWSHIPLAAMAAKQVGHPVKLVLKREHMYGMVGYRPQTEQKVMLGADSAGALTVSRHEVLSNTSSFDEFVEPCAIVTRMLYTSPNQETTHRLSRLDAGTPTFMRAPGESSGSWALESAMDELAYAAKIDPVELRLKNYAETDPENGKPFSSKSLRQCYQVGASRFDWGKRDPKPRSMRSPDGRLLGMGMASATYPANRGTASALARLLPDGSAYVQAGSQDIGTGTYTIMTQIAADALGLPPEKVRFELGDTVMPETPVSGGSQTASSTGSAVKEACQMARQQAIQKAVADTASPLHGLPEADIEVREGRLLSRSNGTRSEGYADLIKRSGLPAIEAKTESKPGQERQKYSFHSFGAVFVETLVDPDLGEIRLSRITGVYGVGTVLNAKTCRSQLIGGIVYGVGMAMMEETLMDSRTGRVMNADMAEYHVPVNADIPPIDIVFVEEQDPYVNPIGAKGVGEIGITGVVAAIGNAVYHATGVRVRELPITLDKVFKGA